MWVSTIEVNYPIWENILRGVAFVDIGTVEDDIGISTIRADIGVGARITIPFFGQLPLALDFAFPLSKKDGDETQLLSFALGIPF
jgi:outer membrane protein insertion porin family